MKRMRESTPTAASRLWPRAVDAGKLEAIIALVSEGWIIDAAAQHVGVDMRSIRALLRAGARERRRMKEHRSATANAPQSASLRFSTAISSAMRLGAERRRAGTSTEPWQVAAERLERRRQQPAARRRGARTNERR